MAGHGNRIIMMALVLLTVACSTKVDEQSRTGSLCRQQGDVINIADTAYTNQRLRIAVVSRSAGYAGVTFLPLISVDYSNIVRVVDECDNHVMYNLESADAINLVAAVERILTNSSKDVQPDARSVDVCFGVDVELKLLEQQCRYMDIPKIVGLIKTVMKNEQSLTFLRINEKNGSWSYSQKQWLEKYPVNNTSH